MIVIGGKGYELVLDHKDGWNPEAFRGRYSEVLDRYDYIIGDWGYSQLRLKGFYRDNHPKVNRDTAISGMVDYINEYCNFGCAYFVLQKMKEMPKDSGERDILLKDPVESTVEPEQEGGSGEAAAAPFREPREKPGPSRPAAKGKENGGGKEHSGKDRPAREHNGRHHRNKDGHHKKGNRPAQQQQNQQQQNQLNQQQQNQPQNSN
ncbi:YutD family protein [Paenibacillus tepidiphilus]|uniref:YutD family protein n=1 Tax=Paenibacillus tepidiphilus TaxID=2608683 RepID=UPI00123C1CE7|nr:YutD family protein [Paenibacillus tepidiphilus]